MPGKKSREFWKWRTRELFLDEVENFNSFLQEKLLSVLSEKSFMRVGGHEDISIDFRIISASNDNILKKVHKGCFRSALFFRIKGAEMHLPPLRERPEDIYPLAEHFLELLNQTENGQWSFQPDVKPLLESFPWLGNARELQNEIKKASLRVSGDEICGKSFKLNFDQAFFLVDKKMKYMSIEQNEKMLISQVLRRENFNKTRPKNWELA